MKKTFFIFITLVITYFLIEFSSWTIVKLYKFLNNSNLISQTLQKDIIDLRAEYEYFAFYGWKKKDIETKEGNYIRKYIPLFNVDKDPVKSSISYGRYA